VATVANEEIARAYLDALVARDYERLESLLADDFQLRDLSPPGIHRSERLGVSTHGDAGDARHVRHRGACRVGRVRDRERSEGRWAADEANQPGEPPATPLVRQRD
jgi:hypothetical protein